LKRWCFDKINNAVKSGIQPYASGSNVVGDASAAHAPSCNSGTTVSAAVSAAAQHVWGPLEGVYSAFGGKSSWPWRSTEARDAFVDNLTFTLVAAGVVATAGVVVGVYKLKEKLPLRFECAWLQPLNPYYPYSGFLVSNFAFNKWVNLFSYTLALSAVGRSGNSGGAVQDKFAA
jgi:hypothetical protein